MYFWSSLRRVKLNKSRKNRMLSQDNEFKDINFHTFAQGVCVTRNARTRNLRMIVANWSVNSFDSWIQTWQKWAEEGRWRNANRLSLPFFSSPPPPFPSRASYFRFARFITSTLYYLRAWHRLGTFQCNKTPQTYQALIEPLWLWWLTDFISWYFNMVTFDSTPLQRLPSTKDTTTFYILHRGRVSQLWGGLPCGHPGYSIWERCF